MKVEHDATNAYPFFVVALAVKPGSDQWAFVAGEVDMVASIGYNPARLPKGYTFADIDIRQIITNLCILDFDGPDRQIRIRSLHPGVSVDDVVGNTGFPLCVPNEIPVTPEPSEAQLALLAVLDPHNLRASALGA